MSNKFFSEYEDKIRYEKITYKQKNRYSKYCDFIYYPSSINPELVLAMRILKPEKPSYIIAGTHGWHMSIPEFCEMDTPQTKYLRVAVDMRGRAFSDGKQDCNGWELYDVIDAIEYVKVHYKEYILDDQIVYFEAGSGGGGNAFAIAGKFPDYFAHVTALSGMSDYELWYQNDAKGEFRDELDVWIGDVNDKEAYASRSGITAVGNLCSPMSIVHGELDIRVPAYHSRNFVQAAKEKGKGHLVSYLELAGIGGKDHYDNLTEELRLQMNAFYEDKRKTCKAPVNIPQKGTMTVCGYLFTKSFQIILNDINKVATVNYDLDNDIIDIVGMKEDQYTVKRL